MKHIAVVFAGGIGRRMNSKALPKQFLRLYGKEIIVYTLEHFQNHSEIDAIAVACVEDWIPFLKELIEKYRLDKVQKIVPGGGNRTAVYLPWALCGGRTCSGRKNSCSDS